MNIAILILAIVIILVIVYFLLRNKHITTTTLAPTTTLSPTTTIIPAVGMDIYFDEVLTSYGGVYNYVPPMINSDTIKAGHLKIYAVDESITISNVEIANAGFTYISPAFPFTIPSNDNQTCIIRFEGNSIPDIYTSTINVYHNSTGVINPYIITIQIQVI